ncbi:sialidase family protein [Brachybacterium paraconglomeratum]|uniref:sialidase family protein n=1 Tax=Brachybacterium paraconglomeratum TaxID=173362 RepID=UPI0022E8BC92|nr:sialidase family protein [Brachybacterium paraconglomeratum]
MIRLGHDPSPTPELPVLTGASTVLARAGEGPWPRYRIVALADLGGGELLAAFDGRETGQDVPDPTGLVQRRSLDGGRTWEGFETLREADRADRHWYCDPSFIVDEPAGRVHVFHTHAKNRGVWDAAAGPDDADRDVMGSAVSTSTDGGRTWTHRSVTAIAAPPDLIRTAFPTSGTGLRLRQGPHAGRLVQPYAGWFLAGEGAGTGTTDGEGTADGESPADGERPSDSESTADGARKVDSESAADGAREVVRSYVLWSDDHGETWHRGEPVGEDMDETTIVELSDGRILLNSRDHARGGHRRIALSSDGGETWADLGIDEQFVDPGNNAQLARRFPEAQPGDPRAQELLFTNSHDPFARRLGTLSRSLDDGATWEPVGLFEPGNLDYSVVQPLDDGAIGILWEVEAREIRFTRLEPEDLPEE